MTLQFSVAHLVLQIFDNFANKCADECKGRKTSNPQIDVVRQSNVIHHIDAVHIALLQSQVGNIAERNQ